MASGLRLLPQTFKAAVVQNAIRYIQLKSETNIICCGLGVTSLKQFVCPAIFMKVTHKYMVTYYRPSK